MRHDYLDVLRRLDAGEPTISIEDLGVILSLGRSTAYNAVKDGQVPAIKVRGRYRIPSAWVRQLLQLEGHTGPDRLLAGGVGAA
ncbi:helix-turn-helix domain-containing protein [Nocardia sp. NPDC101769]|uniref:helix-turn-helix domain-containing protein n=1 Tax=Nocardia sp. NPDC101769 TaxID=3364333 RepID=UPI003810A9F7